MSSSSPLRRGLVAAVFILGLWGSALVLSGHSSLRPLHRFGTFLSQVVFSGNNSSVLIGLDAVVGDPARFHLDPTWDVHAAPVTRIYNWTVSEVWGRPGHISKRMIVVNGISPGPTIEANFGDRIIVHVTNTIENATAIHWHGQFQNGTNHYDGTFGITQCGIPPNGGMMTYNFTVQNVGTYWWHGHHSTQRTDGYYGAMVLHSLDEPARTTIPYDEEIVIALSDLYNTFSQDLLWRYRRYGTGINGQPGDEPVGDGATINGISQAKCAYVPSTDSVLPERRSLRPLPRGASGTGRMGQSRRGPANQLTQPLIPQNNTCVEDIDSVVDRYATFDLKRGRTYRLRLINAASLSGMTFSIDGHTLTVVEADGVSVEPRVVNDIFIGAAQRYSVIVTLDQNDSWYWMRAHIQEEQLRYSGPNFDPTTLAILRYDEGKEPTATAKGKGHSSYTNDFRTRDAPYVPPNLHNDLVPIPHMIAPKATKQETLTVSMQYTSKGEHYSFFNHTSWSPLETNATLFHTQASLLTNAPSLWNHWSQLTSVTTGIEVIDLIVNNLDEGDHPFHLHGHTFFIVGSGAGRYVPPHISDHPMYEFNRENPMRRDTVVLPGFSFVVLRFVSDNPGLWAFHCHITWHLESGLMMQFASLAGLERLEIPPELVAACPSEGTSN